jgi:hypothetical protein
MNDPIDDLLSDAFHHRHVPDGVRPSLTDVRMRARRRHQRRLAGTVSAAAITGVGLVAVLATRDPGGKGLSADQGELGGPTSTMCVFSPTPTTVPIEQRTIIEGETPMGVAQGLGITLEALDAANVGNPDYSAFVVGGVVYLPFGGDTGATTTTMYPQPCNPASDGVTTWHCTDPMGTDELGREVFGSCEPQFDGAFATTTTTTTTLPGDLSPVNSSDFVGTTTSSTISLLESTTNVVASPTVPASTPNVVESTTTSLG